MSSELTLGIGAGGVLGLAIEETPGEYEPPTKFFPARSEGLQWQNNPQWRRVVGTGTADPLGAVPGDGHVEGDLDLECLDDLLPYFLLCARGTLVQTGTSPNFVYTFTPHHRALPDNTMSVTVVRNQQRFGYTGLVVASMTFGVDEGMLTMQFSMRGREEEEVDDPGPPVIPTSQPFGAGSYVLSIPTGNQIFDADNFQFQVEDNGEVANRLIDRRGAAFIHYGERNVQLTMERDFQDRTEYNIFKALTAQGITLRAERPDNADRYVNVVVPGSIIDTYDVSLGDVGGLIRASTTYQAIHNAGVGASYEMEVGTSEDLALNA